VRSLALDDLDANDLCVTTAIGNEKSNQLWEACIAVSTYNMLILGVCMYNTASALLHLAAIVCARLWCATLDRTRSYCY
jgi:hypothetical protein